MRITAGKLRGRKLKIVKNHDFRPTSERVREAIFSCLHPMIDLPSARVLDLYAGSGALGIEAISRGAKKAVFIEEDKNACQAIRDSLEDLGLEGQVYCADVMKRIPVMEERFDLIFIDPPYAEHPGKKLLDELVDKNIIDEEGIIVVESDKYLKMGLQGCLILINEKYYGDTIVRYYRRD